MAATRTASVRNHSLHGTKRRKPCSAAKPLTKTKKFSGKVYTKSTCSRLKSGATKTVKAAREKGKAARVVKNPLTGGYCVYVRGAAKRKTKKKAAAAA